jgi:CheY-like chemotaxis protein
MTVDRGVFMKLRVFVVGSKDRIRDTIEMRLEELGHEVVTASEPMFCSFYRGEGHHCENDLPCGDVLLIDFNLPPMTGLKFIELLRDRGCLMPSANRILMAGVPSVIDRERVQKSGCLVFQKPLSLNQLDEIMVQSMEKLDSKRRLDDLPKII